MNLRKLLEQKSDNHSTKSNAVFFKPHTDAATSSMSEPLDPEEYQKNYEALLLWFQNAKRQFKDLVQKEGTKRVPELYPSLDSIHQYHNKEAAAEKNKDANEANQRLCAFLRSDTATDNLTCIMEQYAMSYFSTPISQDGTCRHIKINGIIRFLQLSPVEICLLFLESVAHFDERVRNTVPNPCLDILRGGVEASQHKFTSEVDLFLQELQEKNLQMLTTERLKKAIKESLFSDRDKKSLFEAAAFTRRFTKNAEQHKVLDQFLEATKSASTLQDMLLLTRDFMLLNPMDKSNRESGFILFAMIYFTESFPMRHMSISHRNLISEALEYSKFANGKYPFSSMGASSFFDWASPRLQNLYPPKWYPIIYQSTQAASPPNNEPPVVSVAPSKRRCNIM